MGRMAQLRRIPKPNSLSAMLSSGEMKGRRWVLNRTQSVEHAGTKPTDHDIPDLRAAMSGDFLD